MTEQNPPLANFFQPIREILQPSIMEAERGSLEKTKFLLVPDGMKAQAIDEFLEKNREKPKRRTGTATLTELGSFIQLVNRFKNTESALFASVKIEDQAINAGITAVFDYHPAGPDVTNTANGTHRAKYGFPISKEFRFWLENNKTPMSQIDFAYFLEQRICEMSSPVDADKAAVEGLKPKFADPLEMLELSRNLEIYSDESFVSKNKLSSGETELKFTSQHKDASGKPIQVPDFFVINIPIFDGGAPQRILSHLRYRKKDSIILWFYELYRIDRVLQEAFTQSCEHVTKLVDLPLYHGSDEFRGA